MRLFLLLLILIPFACFFATPSHAAGSVYTMKVGDFEVSMLSEAQRAGDPKILIGATEEDMKKFIPDGTFPNAVCAYLVKAPDRICLVDTGFGTHLFENMASLGVKAEDVDVLLLTHSHGDHIGGMVKDGRATLPKARVYADEKEIAWSEPLRKNLELYKGSGNSFTPGTLKENGAELFPGVRAIAAYGHTPGHTMFLLESKGERLLIWGDLAHAMAIQMPRPGVSVTYDADPAMAAKTRKEVLNYAAENKIPVAGMHVAYPGMGKVLFDDRAKESYQFEPVK